MSVTRTNCDCKLSTFGTITKGLQTNLSLLRFFRGEFKRYSAQNVGLHEVYLIYLLECDSEILNHTHEYQVEINFQ